MPPLLGREQEIEDLAEIIASGVERGSVLLVTGEPGIGKSALIAKARTLASAAGYRVLTAAGVGKRDAAFPSGVSNRSWHR